MRLVDTSAWIEWFIDTLTAEAIAPELPRPADWLVPTIVQLELAKWIRREVSPEKADEVIAYSQECRVIPLTTEIALAAADFAQQHKLPIADAIIYATARANDADLLTCDAHFKDLPDVAYIEKRK
jgi:predicted nucleic acid-binding protein